MLILKISFIAAIYIAIGGLMCGLVDDEDHQAYYVILWPLFFVVAIILIISEFPRRFGKEFHDRWWGK